MDQRPIANFPDYTIDRDGVIRRGSDCIGSHGQVIFPAGRVMKQQIVNGYASVRLVRDGKASFCYVHRLALATFFPGSLDNGHEVNHRDGDRLNNKIDNLEACDHRTNQIHMVKMRRMYGGRHKWAKITEEQAAEALRKRAAGATIKSIADEYGVGEGAIQHLCSGRNWKHLHKSGTR